MAGTIKGIIVEIGGDTSNLQKALNKVNSQSSNLSKELKGINSLLKLDPKNIELLQQKQTVLNESIDTTQKKLNQLKAIKQEADKKMSEGTKISEENYRNLQREIINTERKLNNLTNDLKQFIVENSNWTKAGKKIEEYSDKITKVSKKADEIGNKASIVSGAVVAGGTALVNSAMNLDDALAKYINTTNTAKEETEQYKEVLESIDRNNYGEGYEDIANSMASVKMQLKDINSQDLKNITEKAIAFRDLFGYEVSESIRSVKALMDNFNISADEAFNLLAEGKKKGLDFSNELLDNVNEYSVQFKKLGFTADDMFNIFKSGAENGAFNLDKIGDAIKEFSIRAIDGSNTTIEGFKKIGLNANTMAKKFAQGGDVAKQAFIEVVQKIGNMNNKVEQSIVGVDLFGTMWEDLGPKVVTSFSKMDNGISKSSNAMQESIDGLYNTTKKKAEAQLRRLKSLGADFGKEMLPTLEKIIDKAEDFIKCLEGMSDAEKENVVKIGLFVAGIGPATKVLGTAGKVVGTTTKGIGTLSKAIGLMGKTSTDAFNEASKGTQMLAKGLTALTSPTGLATMAITALAAGLAYVAYEQAEATKKSREFAKEVKEQKETYEENKKNIDQITNANLAEIDSVNKLKEELKQLVDENGKVKEGYESRVDFILKQLNKALGTEYQLNDNIIQSYKELQGEIDKTIEKKKAEIILNGKEEKYTNAVNIETEAVKKLKEAHDNLGTSIGEAKEKLKTLSDKMKELEKAGDIYGEYLNIGKEKKNLENLINAYENANNTVKQCTEDKKSYENTYALFVEGKYDEIGEIVKNTTSNWSNESLKTIKNTIEQESHNLKKYQKMYEETGNEIVKQQLMQTQQNLQNLANELVARTNTIGSLGIDEISAWRTLANNSFEEYKKAISKMKPEIQQQIQEATGIIVNDTAMQTASGNLATRTVNAMERRKKAKETGQNIIKGLQEGIKDKYLQTQLMNSSATLADNMIKKMNLSAGVQSPSKYTRQTGQFVDEGLILGLKDKENEVLEKASRMSNLLIEKIKPKLNFDFIDTGKFQGVLSGKIASQTKNISNDNRKITFNIQGNNAKEIADEINKIFGSQY